VSYDDTDWATIARRSSTGFKLEVTGVQSHSSQIFSNVVGAGAIFEISRILAEFYDQLTGEELLTFNVGAITGGTVVEYDAEQNRGSAFGKTNVVPNTAIAQGGIRTITQEQLERTRDAMRPIVDQHLPQTNAIISFTEGYPPMSPTDGNKDLQERFSAINVDLGRDPMPALDPGRRGAADISFVAPYTDALAGLGALGEGGHTPHESLELDSMALATKRAAIMIYRLSQE
jgi:glutamate carboxypeptidase